MLASASHCSTGEVVTAAACCGPAAREHMTNAQVAKPAGGWALRAAGRVPKARDSR